MKPACLALVFALSLTATVASAQTDTTFTYQGELRENGSSANGLFDFEFSVVNGSGVSFWSTVSLNDVPVVNGKFTVELDFGASVFDRSPRQSDPYRWLAITVNGNQLNPPQLLNSVPYAIQTRGMHVSDFGRIELWPNVTVDINGDSPTLRISDVGCGVPACYFGLTDVSSALAQIQKYSASGPALIDIDPMPRDRFGDATLRLFRSTDTQGLKRVVFYRGNNTTTTSASIGLDGADSYFQIQGGSVGIGTATPDQDVKLDVQSDDDYAIFATAGKVGIYAYATMSGSTVGVLGETSSPTGAGVAGVANNFQGIGESYGVYGRSNSPSGFDFYAAGAGQDYGSSSSRRWKSNVTAIDQPLTKIEQLQGVYFDWDKEHGGHHDVGMIAEEVGKVLPEIVQYETNGVDAIGMDYSKVTPLLVEAVNALREQKDAEIGELKQQVKDLRQLVHQLMSEKE